MKRSNDILKTATEIKEKLATGVLRAVNSIQGSAGMLNFTGQRIIIDGTNIGLEANKVHTSANKVDSSVNKVVTSVNKVDSAANKVHTSVNKVDTSANKLVSATNKVAGAANKNDRVKANIDRNKPLLRVVNQIISNFRLKKLISAVDYYLHYTNDVMFYIVGTSAVKDMIVSLISRVLSAADMMANYVRVKTAKVKYFIIRTERAVIFDGVIERYCGVPP